jgi:hypothetical protein
MYVFIHISARLRAVLHQGNLELLMQFAVIRFSHFISGHASMGVGMESARLDVLKLHPRFSTGP